MSDMKSARLTGSLITRKGMASPSAAPASRANMVKSMQTARTDAPPPARLEPAPKRETLADWIAPHLHKNGSTEPAPALRMTGEKRIRVSLRLEQDRHMRLKLAATHLNRTLQSIFTQAIDEFFERHTPDVASAIDLLQPSCRSKAGGE